MDVAILHSGGKDSTFAIDHAIEQGWNIKYILSVKPSRKDCFLFHYATVEHTPLLAGMLGIPHVLVGCDVADAKLEADIVKREVENMPKVDAVILGGTGLQETQLRSISEALQPMHIEVFAAHAGYDHEEVVKQMLEKGYRFMLTQVASDGLMQWLGKEITTENFAQLKKDSVKYGFHIGFEGGYADTFCFDGPIFTKKIDILETKKVVEDMYNGHIEFTKIALVEKPLVVA